ncbi:MULTISPECIES: PfaD family polyunsaturated fatty acid/polyketide biosynthesis protein [Sorangium]|nr:MULTISPECIES: PfaD family polyunsaturated fatty acid/polyketide biosynthesis protein [Sorangium]
MNVESSRMTTEHRRPSARITPERLGDPGFQKTYRVKYSYTAGAMYKGISSVALVVRMGKSMLLSFFGTGGLSLQETEAGILRIQSELSDGQPYGMNFLADPDDPEREIARANLYLKHGVRNIEASAFTQITPGLVRYRVSTLAANPDSSIHVPNRIIAKLSHPKVAEAFLSPPPEKLLAQLVSASLITEQHASMARRIPMADDICVEADSGGHTDKGVGWVLLPAIMHQRDEARAKHGYQRRVRVGLAGGIGTPQAAAGAFALGADFIGTGSINQCTVEAGTSDLVKELLQDMDIHDTAMIPAGDMFELGARAQVLRKGLLFPGRANRLYDLWRHHQSLDELDERTRAELEKNYFKRSLEQVYEDVRAYHLQRRPEEIHRAERDPKHKMALVFKWYFAHTSNLALRGVAERKVDFQIHCGPALGSFNRWVRGTRHESWRNRHVDDLAEMLMQQAAAALEQRLYACSVE